MTVGTAEKRFRFIIGQKDNEMEKINLNDKIKVKLTPHGVDVYYHQFDNLNKKIIQCGGVPLENRMPQIDKDGFTEFQLWDFIQIYGKYIGMSKENVIVDLNIYF